MSRIVLALSLLFTFTTALVGAAAQKPAACYDWIARDK
jgi:hypothetical protein